MSLTPPLKVQKLQTALHAKAKGSPGYRFYALYDKIYRRDILQHAFDVCRTNGGVAGVDEQTFRRIEEYGVGRWLDELTEELRTEAYRPQAVRRVYIPKPDGKQRPLGIPTIKDRVVQTAALLVLEPIFEADLADEQHAYRPGRSALDAVKRVDELLCRGYQDVVDADLSGYFDTIPHDDLLKSVARRVSDGRMLRLVKRWLEAPVEEVDERGRKKTTTRNKDEGKGTPQGAPISPLLSNLEMRRFVLGWKRLGHEQRLAARIVNYADDFVICCCGTADEAMLAMREMMERLRLTVNETKTRIRRLPGEEFDFLGYTFGRCWSWKQNCWYRGLKPSQKKVQSLARAISDLTSSRTTHQDEEWLIGRLNSMLIGWGNYFRLGAVSSDYRWLDYHAGQRVRQWLRRKHKVQSRRSTRFGWHTLYQQLGLVRLQERARRLPWANRVQAATEAGCGKSARPV
jgi:RNA-directed DNA polymerase